MICLLCFVTTKHCLLVGGMCLCVCVCVCILRAIYPKALCTWKEITDYKYQEAIIPQSAQVSKDAGHHKAHHWMMPCAIGYHNQLDIDWSVVTADGRVSQSQRPASFTFTSQKPVLLGHQLMCRNITSSTEVCLYTQHLKHQYMLALIDAGCSFLSAPRALVICVLQ